MHERLKTCFRRGVKTLQRCLIEQLQSVANARNEENLLKSSTILKYNGADKSTDGPMQSKVNAINRLKQWKGTMSTVVAMGQARDDVR